MTTSRGFRVRGDDILFPLQEVAETMSGWFDLLSGWEAPVSKLPHSLATGSSFPPCNWYSDEQNNLYYEFAVAGFSKDEINLSLNDDLLILTIIPLPAKEKDTRKQLQKGIKRCESVSQYRIPLSKYNLQKVESKLENGILSVMIPAKEDTKPIKINIG